MLMYDNYWRIAKKDLALQFSQFPRQLATFLDKVLNWHIVALFLQ